MNNWLLFLLKSTISISLLYLFFRLLIRKEAFFKLSRMTLIFIVFASTIIPFITLPQSIHPVLPITIAPIFQNNTIIDESVQTKEVPAAIFSSVSSSEKIHPIVISIKSIVIFIYLAGVIISFLLFVYSIGSVLLLFRKSRKTDLNGIHLMIVNEDITAFSFRRFILISQFDYDTNSEAILTHEFSHIRQGHFYDLMLMELVKIIYWFNPLVYRMDSDLKEIHEFQADEHTLNSGIDTTKYQLLIIQKCVGHQQFALANSFNHCQIKNRINLIRKFLIVVYPFMVFLALSDLFDSIKSSKTSITEVDLRTVDTSGIFKRFVNSKSDGFLLSFVTLLNSILACDSTSSINEFIFEFSSYSFEVTEESFNLWFFLFQSRIRTFPNFIL